MRVNSAAFRSDSRSYGPLLTHVCEHLHIWPACRVEAVAGPLHIRSGFAVAT